MSYNSKYTGTQVEDLLDQVANGNVGGGGGITSETDPIFSASPAAGITDENISSWNNKVDKVEGKQLSTEDFTTLLKQKLDGLSNYDDTEISQAVETLRGDFDTLVSGDTTAAIKTFNEVIDFLEGLEDTEDLASIIASIEQQIAAKQDKIDDLETIRDGAALGATALQEVPSGYAKTNDIPTKVSELENDVPYTVDSKVPNGVYVVKPDGSLMDYQLISGRDETCIAVALVTDNQSIWIEKNNSKNTISAALARTEDGVTTSNYTTFYWGSPRINIEEIEDYSYYGDALSDFKGKQNTLFLQKFASTTRASIKSYCDSFNQTPDENQGFSDWYIPAAGQTYEIYENSGAINAALSRINGSSLPNQNVWSSSENSMHNAYAGRTTVTPYRKDSPYPVVFVRDFSNSSLLERVEELETTKQDTLVSGTNIKTINGESILGSGDIVIEGGAKVYTWNWDGESESVTLSQEEYDNIAEANIVVLDIGGVYSATVDKAGKEFSEAIGQYGLDGIINLQGSTMIIHISIEISTKLATFTMEELNIPTKTSQLENDSNFVSSDGLKTINGESIVGSGDIVISSGSSSGSGAYAEVSHGTSDTTFTLTSNTFHVWDEVATLDLSFGEETSGVANEYLFQFTSGATATSLTVPDTVEWVDGTPTIEANKTYQVSIVNNIGLIVGV